MGSSIIKSYLRQNFDSKDIKVVKPTINNKISGIEYYQDLSQIPDGFSPNIIFLAFKPQNAPLILQNIKDNSHILAQDKIFISIMAGKTIEYLQNTLGKNEKIIRVMPNLPIEFNEGLSLYFHNDNIANNDCLNILKPIGKIIKVQKEALINSLTPISGSGPAILFLFAKYLTQITHKLGVSNKDALEIVKQTIFGSAKMLNQSDKDLDALISDVTSKKGVTAACLEILDDDEFSNILEKSINYGVEKAKNL